MSFTLVLSYLETKEIVPIQILDRFQYQIGVPRALKVTPISFRQAFAYDEKNHAIKFYNSEKNIVTTHPLAGINEDNDLYKPFYTSYINYN